MRREFPQQILEKYSNTKYHENPSSGSRSVPCGQTDGHDAANSRLSKFCDRTWRRYNTCGKQHKCRCSKLWTVSVLQPTVGAVSRPHSVAGNCHHTASTAGFGDGGRSRGPIDTDRCGCRAGCNCPQTHTHTHTHIHTHTQTHAHTPHTYTHTPHTHTPHPHTHTTHTHHTYTHTPHIHTHSSIMQFEPRIRY